MAVDCKNCPLRKQPTFIEMSRDELAFMRGFKRGELSVDAGSTILMEGSNSPQLFTALKGIGLRYKTLEDGARQVINFVLPGDFVGLQAGLMGEMQHSVEAVTDMTLCVFSRDALWEMFKSQPERAYDLTWISAVQEHFLGENLSVVGRRSGLERIAWGILKYFARMESLELTKGATVPMPFRQQDLADALGLSLVHTNKTLRTLRERQIAHWEGDTLKIFNIAALQDVAKVDGYDILPRPLL